jgi:predicted ATPase
VQTIDVFAVVALSGILNRLLSTGTVLVATSNKAPEDLNQVGPFFSLFFICVINQTLIFSPKVESVSERHKHIQTC